MFLFWFFSIFVSFLCLRRILVLRLLREFVFLVCFFFLIVVIVFLVVLVDLWIFIFVLMGFCLLVVGLWWVRGLMIVVVNVWNILVFIFLEERVEKSCGVVFLRVVFSNFFCCGVEILVFFLNFCFFSFFRRYCFCFCFLVFSLLMVF